MNDLQKYFENNKGNQIHKWSHYFDIYEKHFAKFRDQEIVLLEIGVQEGGSLQMWRNYFPNAKIYGVDIMPECKTLEGDAKIFIGSQNDTTFLKTLCTKIPPVDILIDDGSHNSSHQILTFQELFGLVKEGGLYVCEDTHTSYWLKYGGGHKRRSTFIEFMKKRIDDLHAYHAKQRSLKPNKYTQQISSITFHDSIVVVEKGSHENPKSIWSGNAVLPPRKSKYSPRIKKIRHHILYVINYILRALKLPAFLWK